MVSAACHLTEEELDDVILGVACAEVQAHCAACASCGSRVSTFAASIRPFNEASLAWSEARSNTFTRDLSGHMPAWRLTAFAARSVSATIVLGLVAGVLAGTHPQPSAGAAALTEAVLQPPVHGFTADLRAQQIARDNAMLQAIDAELTEPESAPAALFRAADSTGVQPTSDQDRD